MPESTLTWLAVSGYFVLMAATGAFSRRASSFRTFAIGERSRHPVFIGMAAAAGAVSSTSFLINPGLVWRYGFSAFVALALTSSLGLLLGFVLFSKSFRIVGEKFDALTVAQWIGDRYGSARLRLFFGCISLLQTAYIVLIVVSLGQLLSTALDLPLIPASLFVLVFTCAYIFFGGTTTHILTNFLQCIVMVVVALLLIGSGLHHLAGGPGPFFERLAQAGAHLSEPTNPASDLYRDAFETFFAQFVIGSATALLPHLIVKPLYLRDDREVSVYITTAVALIILFKLVVVAGLYARLELGAPEGMTPDNVMPTYFVTHFPPAVRAFVTVGVLAAGFSTLEAIILALASIFSHDVAQPALRALGRPPADSLRLARVFFALLIPVAGVLTWQQIVSPSLSVIIFAYNGVLAFSAAIVPTIGFGIYSKSRSALAATVSAGTALLVFYGMKTFEITMYHANPMVPATLGLLAGLVVFPLVARFDSLRTGTAA